MSESIVTIRKYRESDKDNLIEVLQVTSSLPIETEKQRKFLRLLYNDYYTEAEPENCFVVADSDDKAVGYIICAENYEAYEKNFNKFYMPDILKESFAYYLSAKAEMLGHKFYKKRYPAHLHIDILPEYQGQGAGSKLMNALCAHLKAKGVKGLMLSCSASNTGAIRFYERNNFKVLKKLSGSCLMGKEL